MDVLPEILAAIFSLFFLTILLMDDSKPEKFSSGNDYRNLETMDDQPDKISDASIIPCNPSPRFIPRKIKAVGVSIRG